MHQEIVGRPAMPNSGGYGRCYTADCVTSWPDMTTEPTLDEILADPIVHLVLGRDHLEIRDVERFLKAASRRLADRTVMTTLGQGD